MSTRHHVEGTGRRNDFETFTGRLRRDTGISLAVRLRAKQNKTKHFKKIKKERKKQHGLAGDVTGKRKKCVHSGVEMKVSSLLMLM